MVSFINNQWLHLFPWLHLSVSSFLDDVLFQFLDDVLLIWWDPALCLPRIFGYGSVFFVFFNGISTSCSAGCPLHQSPSLKGRNETLVDGRWSCWAICLDGLLGGQDLFKDCSPTPADVILEFAWANHRRWSIHSFLQIFLPHRALARGTWTTRTAVDDGAILTLVHLILTLVIRLRITSLGALSLDLNWIDLPLALIKCAEPISWSRAW